jgi:hypothetical protein
VDIGYRGAYDNVQRYVRRWKTAKSGPALTQAFVPLSFAPGEVCQFDWSLELGGVMQTIKVAHFRLTFSRQMFVVAYPRETQEMVFDAHNRAFAFFGGAPQRMVYDNLKAVVETILTGKERLFNRRFLVLANHYLFGPVEGIASVIMRTTLGVNRPGTPTVSETWRTDLGPETVAGRTLWTGSARLCTEIQQPSRERTVVG